MNSTQNALLRSCPRDDVIKGKMRNGQNPYQPMQIDTQAETAEDARHASQISSTTNSASIDHRSGNEGELQVHDMNDTSDFRKIQAGERVRLWKVEQESFISGNDVNDESDHIEPFGSDDSLPADPCDLIRFSRAVSEVDFFRGLATADESLRPSPSQDNTRDPTLRVTTMQPQSSTAAMMAFE